MKYYYYGCLIIAALLSGCGQKIHTATITSPITRIVATVYAVQTETDSVTCHQLPDARSLVVTPLRKHQQVDLVSLQGSMEQHGEEYWLHVYPHDTIHTPCYVNVRYLMPLAG
jgi:hypothetical protein